MEKDPYLRKIHNNSRMIKVALAGIAPQQGFNHVIGPNLADNTQHTESKTKMELETLCLAEASQRFMQASKTPFLTSPLINIFMEANLSTKAFGQVLEGHLSSP